MAIVPIKKISLFSLKKNKKDILDFVHASGMFDVIEQSDAELSVVDTEPGLEKDILSIEHVVSILSQRKAKEKISLAEKVALAGKVRVKKNQFEDITSSYDYVSVLGDVRNAEMRLQHLIDENVALEEDKELFQMWQTVGFSAKGFEDMDRWQVLFGRVSASISGSFEEAVQKTFDLSSIDVVQQDEKFVYYALVVQREEKDKLSSLVLDFAFEEVELLKGDITPKERLAAIEKNISDNVQEIKDVEKKLKKWAKTDLVSLKIMHDHLSWRKEMGDLSDVFGATDEVFYVTAWVREDDIPEIKKHSSKVSEAYHLTVLEPDEGEKVPVVLENNAGITPFESVTNVYGYPKHNEVDPTPYLAPFFIVYFALCLTDAGYGLILAIGAFTAIKILKIPREKQKLIRLMGFGGIATFIIGALFGGWFGVESQYLPAFLQNIQLVNPLDDVMLVLGLSAVLGLIQIIVGLFIRIQWAFRKKMYEKEIFIDLLWLIILSAGGFYLVFSQAVEVSVVAQIMLYLIYISAVLVVLLSGTDLFAKKIAAIKEKDGKSGMYYAWLVGGFILGLPIRIVSGILGLYTVVGYVSDILSYSRLLALGLATGIIAMAINIIASLVGDMIPGVGIVFMILVLVGGHLFNIAINVLGAYIHSGRLQFVEFFPKFIEGGGEAFVPVKRSGKYIELQ